MKPLFVIGHPKSGTSLLNSLLDNHPKLLVLSEESDFYQAIWNKANLLNYEWRKSDEIKVSEIYSYIIDKTHFSNYLRGTVEKDISGNLDYSHLDAERFKNTLKNTLPKSLHNGKFQRLGIIHVLLEAYKELIEVTNQTYSFWVEKTPKHTWFIDEIVSDWPDASFIFVYRDPRDNFVSYKKKWGDALTIAKFCKTWNDAILRYDQIPSHVPKIMVSYETLIRNQKEEIERIAAFLDISVGPTLFAPTKLGKAWKGNSMFDLASAEMHDKSIGRYETALSVENIRAMEFFTADNMRRLGYQLSTDAAPDRIENVASLQTEYNNYFPFNIGAPLSLRSKLGLLRRRLIG